MKIFIKIIVGLLLLLVVAALAIWFRPSLILDKESVKKEVALPSSHFMQWKDAKVHYTLEGKGSRTILMIHGFGGSFRNFDNLMPYLQDSFRIIRLDLPGFGLSDYTKDSDGSILGNYSDFFTTFFDTLQLDSVILMGNSMGGAVSWTIASQRPEKISRMILLNSAGYEIEKAASKMLVFKYKTVSDIFKKGLPLSLSKNGLEKCYADDSKINFADATLNNKITNKKGNLDFMVLMAERKEFPSSANIKKVQCPTLIIWGKEDEIIPVAHADSFHRNIKNSIKKIYSS